MNSCLCRDWGKRLITRSIAWWALFACSVESARCPVLHSSRAASMVGWSRISPMRITSGASRRELRRALR